MKYLFCILTSLFALSGCASGKVVKESVPKKNYYYDGVLGENVEKLWFSEYADYTDAAYGDIELSALLIMNLPDGSNFFRLEAFSINMLVPAEFRMDGFYVGEQEKWTHEGCIFKLIHKRFELPTNARVSKYIMEGSCEDSDVITRYIYFQGVGITSIINGKRANGKLDVESIFLLRHGTEGLGK